MSPGALLLLHSRSDAHARAAAAEVARLESALAGDAQIEEAQRGLASVQEAQKDAARRLRESEREVEDHRARMHQRDRELMSGRIRNPTELSKLSDEVDHMRTRIATEEDAELALMEELEARDSEVRQAEEALRKLREARESAAPELRRQLEAARTSLATFEAERDAAWAEVPPDYQAAARRIRVQPPVAEVVGNQCGECHVAITSGGLQRLRRGELLTCDNCGRILVLG
jgi:predicted  nucleic acid-binding Zn-ribbon protein